MTIFKDAYDTTIGAAFDRSQLEKLKQAIKASLINDGYNKTRALGVMPIDEWSPLFITGLFPSESEVPLFTHPITIMDGDNKKYVCSDVRMFIRKESFEKDQDIQKCVRNRPEYEFTVLRTILTMLWVAEGPAKIRANLGFAGAVYGNLISDVIARSYALNFQELSVLTILGCAFYGSLFEEGEELDETIRQRWAVSIKRAMNLPSDLIFEVLDGLSVIKDINAFCATVVGTIENVRLKNFNPAALLTLIRSSWYGTNSKEIIAVAIEHPPTMCAMVYTALMDRTYKSSNMYKVAERLSKRGAGDDFFKNVKMIVSSVMMENDKVHEKDPYQLGDFK